MSCSAAGRPSASTWRCGSRFPASWPDRAGAPLPTLFIDEGFGTQDPGGRDRIVDALNAIRDDFERIIVITHIEELKEQFPARIQVEKGPEGATFSLA